MALNDVKLVLNCKNTNNKDITVNVGYINPNASDVTLKTFGQKLNALTSNTLITTKKVVTTDITAATE